MQEIASKNNKKAFFIILALDLDKTNHILISLENCGHRFISKSNQLLNINKKGQAKCSTFFVFYGKRIKILNF